MSYSPSKDVNVIVEVHRDDECLIYVGGKHYVEADSNFSDLLESAVKLTNVKMDLRKAKVEVSDCCMIAGAVQQELCSGGWSRTRFVRSYYLGPLSLYHAAERLSAAPQTLSAHCYTMTV
jgi:hypothetical protein